MGEPTTLAEGVAVEARLYRSAVSVAATGLIAYRMGAASERRLTWFDRSGVALGAFGDRDPDDLLYPRVSPDGRRVVVSRTVQGNADLWLLDGTRTSRVTFDPAEDRYPLWSPDGSRLAFISNRTNVFAIYVKQMSGAGTEERLVTSDQTKSPSGWSPDGRFLLFNGLASPTNSDIWVLPMAGDRKPWAFQKTSFNERYGVFSADGRWVAYQSNESGRNEIYVRPFAQPGAAGATGGARQVSTSGGITPLWAPNGKELYYVDPAGAMMAAPFTVAGATFEPSAPVVLFATRIYGGGVEAQQWRQYDVAPDGRFLINTVLDADAAPITLLMNWNPEAKK